MSNADIRQQLSKLSPAARQQLLEKLAKKNKNPVAEPEAGNGGGNRYPLSNAQLRMWMFEKFNQTSTAYNIVSALRLVGTPDLEALRWAFQQVVNRHEILRTRFEENDGEVEQVVAGHVEAEIEFIECDDLNFATDSERLQARIAELGDVGFRLAELPLFKLYLLRLNDASSVLVVVLHHIVADGWSLRLLEQEISRFYLAFQQGQSHSQQPCAHQYRDYVQWQSEWLSGSAHQRQLEYWCNALDGAPPLLALPTRKPRHEARSMAASSLVFEFPAPLITKVRHYAAQRSVSLFMVLMAAFKVTLAHIAGVDDITLGTPAANRRKKQFEPVLGLFANTLAIRTQPVGGRSFEQYLEMVRKSTLAAFSNQDLPFEKVVDAVVPERSSHHSPLFQVLFALQATEHSELALAGLAIEPIHIERRLIEFDMVMECFLTPESNTAVLSYRTELFDRVFTDAVSGCLIGLLEWVMAAPEVALQQQCRMLGYRWAPTRTDTRTAIPSFRFDAAAPHAAIANGARAVSYAALHPQIIRLATAITAQQGNSEAPLLIAAENRIELYLALLALQAGGCDHGYIAAAGLAFEPEALLAAGVRIVVCHSGVENNCPPHFRRCSVAALEQAALPAARNLGLQPQANLWICREGTARKLAGEDLSRSITFVQPMLAGEPGGVFIAPDVPLELQLAALYGAMANGQTVIVPEAESWLDNAALHDQYQNARTALLAGQGNFLQRHSRQLPATLRHLVFAGCDYTRLPTFEGVRRTVCFSDTSLRGVCLSQGEDLRLNCRSDVQALWVGNSLAQALPSGVPGRLYLQFDDGGEVETGLLATLSEGIRWLAPAAGGCIWRGGRLCDLGNLGYVINRLGAVNQCFLRVRKDVSGETRLLCYVQVSRRLTEAQLRQEVAALVQSHERPDAFVIVSHIPTTPEGEVDIRALDSAAVLDGLDTTRCGGQVDIVWQEERQGRLRISSSAQGMKTQNSGSAGQRHTAGEEQKDAICHGTPLPAPCPFGCLSEVLQHAATHAPQRSVTHIVDRDGNTLAHGYRSLYASALGVAASLRNSGFKPEDILLLQLVDNNSLTLAFWGCILAGVVPIVAAAPDSFNERNKDAVKIVKVCRSIGIAGVLGCGKTYPQMLDYADMQELQCRFLLFDDLLHSGTRIAPYRARGDATALMLLTSGSTGVPKAVMLSHQALLARTQGEVTAFGFSDAEISFNWMPMDHVGGLVMHHLTYVYLGAEQVHCPTDIVLQEPLLWLEWMSRYRATTTWAPNFAYSLVNERFREQPAAAAAKPWDLSSLRFLYNGGEAVVAAVAREFSAHLTRFGMRPGTLKPVWGMSETCSGVIVNTEYDPDASGEGQAVVDVGRPLPGVNVRIVDSNDELVKEGVNGRLQLSGAIITQGYRNSVEETQKAFTADGWFCTGDLAKIVDGRITITGREKDLVIINGKNHHCQEIEQAVERLPAILSAHVIACGLRLGDDATDKLAIFYSARQPGDSAAPALVHKAVLSDLGVPVSYTIELSPEQFPRTSIGKIQRAPLLKAFENGEFAGGFCDLSSVEELPRWFYKPAWRAVSSATVKGHWDGVLIVGGDASVNRTLRHALSETCTPVRSATFADTFHCTEPAAFQVNPRDVNSWRQLLQSVAAQPGKRLKLVYADPLGWPFSHRELSELTRPQRDPVLLPLVLLSKAIEAERRHFGDIDIQVITQGAYAVTRNDRGNPLQALLNGFVKSMGRELFPARVQQIDVNFQWQENPCQLVRELALAAVEPVVALRDNKRLVRVLEAPGNAELSPQPRQFDYPGFHLVIGGSGGIGEVFVESLLRDERAHVLVVGRSVSTAPERSAVIQVFAQYGNRFAYEQADICDSDRLAQLITRYEQNWRQPLARVFNFAGQNHTEVIAEIEEGNLLRTMKTKLAGPVAVQAAIEKSRPADFKTVEQIHIASVNGYFGGEALSLYAAANSFLASWCEYLFNQGLKVSCYQFSMWDDLGIAAGYKFKKQTLAQGFHILNPRQGVLSILCLASSAPAATWIIGIDPGKAAMQPEVAGRFRPLRKLVADSVTDQTLNDAFGTPVAISKRGADESADTAFENRPLTELETVLADIWRQLLKLDTPIKADDDFFALGGNSLHLTRLVNRLSERFDLTLNVPSFFECSELNRLAAHIEQLQTEKYIKIPVKARSGFEPASFAQHRLWFLDRLQGGSTEYNILAGVRLVGKLDIALIRQTLSYLVRRHDILRTTYHSRNGKCVQNIHPAMDIEMREIDFGAFDPAVQEEKVQSEMQLEMRRGFDLENGPILRARLIRNAEREHVLLFCMHHIASDGWSMAIISREFMALYRSLAKGSEARMPALPAQYADYAEWQRQYQSSEAFGGHLEYWRAQLAGIPAVHQLPLDFPRTEERSVAGKCVKTTLDRETTAALKRLAREYKATLFMLLHSAFSLLLARWSNETDIVIGTPVAGRDHPDLEPLIGFFVNTLVLRSRFDAEWSFADYLAAGRQTVLDAFAHQSVPFDVLIEELDIERSLSHLPLVQVMFALQNYDLAELQLPGLTVSSLDTPLASVRFDLELMAAEKGETLELAWNYATCLFKETTIERLAAGFTVLLGDIIAAPDKSIHALRVLTADEYKTLQAFGRARPEDFDNDCCIHELFEQQAERDPHRIAVEFKGASLNYGRLNEKANRLARVIRERYAQRCGRPMAGDAMVALYLDRGLDMVVAILAVLKAGAAYVPIEPEFPAQRTRFILDDTQASILVSGKRYLETLESLAEGLQHSPEVLCIDEPAAVDSVSAGNLDPAGGAGNLAYSIYTSGTTGQPKGVLVEHRAVISFALNKCYLDPARVSKIASLSSYSYDGFVFDLFYTLLNGKSLHLLIKEQFLSPESLCRYLGQHNIDSLFMTSALFNLVARSGHLGQTGVRNLLFGGEAADVSAIRKVLAENENIHLIHAYGPTETVAFSTAYHFGRETANAPIGRNLKNKCVYVLNHHLHPVPIGTPGELYIGGAGMARGYLNRPDLTAERFIDNPFAEQEKLLAADARLYKTGDIVRWLPDGNLEYLTRSDFQVKIRGFRVELGEVENFLSQLAPVQDAVVVVRGEDHGKHLVGYVVVDPADFTDNLSRELKSELKRRLPDYMVPAAVVCVHELPLNNNGKIDKGALPEVDIEAGVDYVPPATEMERQLVSMVESLLNLDTVSATSNFFDLGGSSLTATVLAIEIEARLHKEIPIRLLFETGSLQALAAALEGIVSRDGEEIARVSAEEPRPLSFAQQQLWLIDQSAGPNSQYNVPYTLKIDGPLDLNALTRAVTTIVERHQILRTVYRAQEGIPFQYVNLAAEVPVAIIDAQDKGLAVDSRQVREWIAEETQKPFDLSADPMIRVKLILLAPHQQILVVTLHHIAADGWSVNILGNEFSQLYRAYSRGSENPLPELPAQYLDYAHWQRNQAAEDNWQRQLAFWRDKLRNAPPLHNLPLDMPRPPEQGSAAAIVEACTDQQLHDSLKTLAAEYDATLFMVLQTAFSVLLSRWSGADDIVMAVPVAGRERKAFAALIGTFTNTLAFRTDLSANPTFADLLRHSREEAIAAFNCGNVPFERVVEEINPKRSRAYNPLCQIKFVLQNHHQNTLALDGVAITPLNALEGEFNQLHFDLDLSIFESGQGLRLYLGFKKALFFPSTMQCMLDSYLQLLRELVERPQRRIKQYPLTSAAQQRALDATRQGGVNHNGRDIPITCQFERMAKQYPIAIAVEMDSESLTYGQLDEKSRRLAASLQRRGIGRGDWVLLHQKRSPALLVSVLAVLKAGAAYIPVDPANSSARLRAILEDAAPKLMLSDENPNAAAAPSGTALFTIGDEVYGESWLSDCANIEIAGSPSLQDSAYAVYTSGSTGRPKGVEISHAALTDYCAYAAAHYYRPELGGAVLATSHGFDLAVPSLFLPLLHGHRVKMFTVDNEIAEFGNLLHQARPGYLIRLTPMHLRALLDLLPEAASYQSPHVFVIGGEAFPVNLARSLQQAFPAAQIYNHYGPSEATVGCCMFDVTANLEALQQVMPIGRPMENTRLFVFDDNLQHCPAGMPGELYIGGSGLAKGYLNRPELTGQRFVVNPHAPDEILYRSGDRARYLADGNLEYLGRSDDQVKLRGYRVELGEIKSLLLERPEVKDAYVTSYGEEEHKIIAAYITSDNPLSDADTARILSGLRESLPDFMVPACIRYLDRLPLNDNGKVDKHSLPEPFVTAVPTEAFEPPETGLQRQVAQIWSTILGVELEKIGLHSDFYALGGQSLLAMRLIAALTSQCKVDISIVDFAENKTLGELCQLLDTRQALRDLSFTGRQELQDEEQEIVI